MWTLKPDAFNKFKASHLLAAPFFSLILVAPIIHFFIPYYIDYRKVAEHICLIAIVLRVFLKNRFIVWSMKIQNANAKNRFIVSESQLYFC